MRAQQWSRIKNAGTIACNCRLKNNAAMNFCGNAGVVWSEVHKCNRVHLDSRDYMVYAIEKTSYNRHTVKTCISTYGARSTGTRI
jgi:hypothetical protein